MDFRPSPRRGTFGEALIALGALAGFFALAWNGTIATWSDVWIYVGILGIIAVFYALLLFARIMFEMATHGSSDSFWWEKYEGNHPRKK